jgi:opacity protein-like surface antigen
VCSCAFADSDALNGFGVDTAASNPPSEEPAYPAVPEYSASSTSVTGFYGGVDVGMSHLKNKTTKRNKTQVKGEAGGTEAVLIVEKKKKGKSGFAWDVFCGYNFQMGKFIIGIEALGGMESSKPRVFTKGSKVEEDESTTTQIESTTLKRKYNFGLVPHVGYNIFGGFNAYLNFGTVVSKYNVKLRSKDKKKEGKDENEKNVKKGKTKASFLLGLGAEQNFGPFFVRAECNKIFKRRLTEIEKKKVDTDSYIFKIGGGYRF